MHAAVNTERKWIKKSFNWSCTVSVTADTLFFSR